MSYNTRRANTGYGTPQQQSTPAGQRRPVVTNNFVPGGQLAGNQQQKPPVQQRTPQQQQQPGVNFRNQNQQGQQPQTYQSKSYSTTPQQPRYQQGLGQQTPVKQEPVVTPAQQIPKPAAPVAVAPVVVATPPVITPAPVVPGANPPPPEQDDAMDASGDGTGKKRFWTKSAKISRAEKIRRRNLKLSKILQPKNAVMILNELVRGCVYNVEELPVKIDVNQFRGTVTFEGQEFAGTGRTKNAAKNSAAETALKHLVKNKQLTNVIKKEEDGDEKMDITEEEEGSQVMPWSHIASFAMYKLFSNWGEDPNLVHRVSAQEIMASSPSTKQQQQPQGPRDPKPAKKMPDNPETMNPMMLMHQMLPNAVWEEVGKSGAPPNVLFKFTVTIDEKQFIGTGTSKKAAKKLAAFSACHDILKVNYPQDVWAPGV